MLGRGDCHTAAVVLSNSWSKYDEQINFGSAHSATFFYQHVPSYQALAAMVPTTSRVASTCPCAVFARSKSGSLHLPGDHPCCRSDADTDGCVVIPTTLDNHSVVLYELEPST